MLGVLRELAERYAQHPSFAGLAVRLSADGYAQLPGPDWGLDDATIAQFERDAKLRVPGDGPQRFAERSAFLAQEPHRRAWLEWRAAATEQVLPPRRRGTGRHPARQPALSGRGRHDRRAGTRGRAAARAAAAHHASPPRCCAWASTPGTIRTTSSGSCCLRPERIAAAEQPRRPRRRPGNRPDGRLRPLLPDRRRRRAACSSTRRAKSASNRSTRRAPSSRATPGWSRSPCPSGEQNRRRFVHSLATLDAQVMVDGGWLLPMGQEDATPRSGGRLPRAAGGPLPAGRQPPDDRRRRSRSPSAAARTAAEPICTPSTTPRSPPRRGFTSRPARPAASRN